MVGGEAEQLRELLPLAHRVPGWLLDCACPADTARDYNVARLALESITGRAGGMAPRGSGVLMAQYLEASLLGGMITGEHVECGESSFWGFLRVISEGCWVAI